jgi:hypothetical protein
MYINLWLNKYIVTKPGVINTHKRYISDFVFKSFSFTLNISQPKKYTLHKKRRFCWHLQFSNNRIIIGDHDRYNGIIIGDHDRYNGIIIGEHDRYNGIIIGDHDR